MQREVNVLALIKGHERFVYVYDDDSRDDLIQHIRDQAASTETRISWFDVAVLTQRAREQSVITDQ